MTWEHTNPPPVDLAVPKVRNVVTMKKEMGDTPLPGTYVGREMRKYSLKASAFANPFKLEREEDRPVVLRQYVQWLFTAEIRSRVHELAGPFPLLCWCAPKACHADVLAEMVGATKFANQPCPRCAKPVESWLNYSRSIARLHEAWVCTACGARGHEARPLLKCLEL